LQFFHFNPICVQFIYDKPFFYLPKFFDFHIFIGKPIINIVMNTFLKHIVTIFLAIQLVVASNQLFAYPPKSSQPSICNNGVELVNSASLDNLIDNLSNSKLVLLGEATHGTQEFYTWRAEISKRLILEQGFNFIAVEGDWASIYRLNLYVKGLSAEYKSAKQVLESFNRWPEWMWANTAIENLAEWLKVHNMALSIEKRIGFYGMDVYGQWEAMDEVLRVTQQLMPEVFPEIVKQFGCYSAYNFDEWQYAMAVQRGYRSCYEGLNWVVEQIREHLKSSENPSDRKLLWHAKQSALVVMNSEDFYRLAVGDNVTSWNSRVMHMHETVNRLLASHGELSKGIVWAHNTHIGDARATSMRNEGLINIGQLSRQTHTDKNVTLIGFTTYEGRVNAGTDWGAPMSIMRIPQAKSGSIESIFKSCRLNNFYIVFNKNLWQSDLLLKPIDHRAIGVIYNPKLESEFNYVPSILSLRYDAMVFIKSTNPLVPIKLF
jgi:erythromycin esterase